VRRALVILLCTPLAAAAAAHAASAPPNPDCVYPAAYPGDTATKPAKAGWMAAGAKARGLPVELPVMGALVESNLENLPEGDSGYAGYFQIRTSLWNQGQYAGFPSKPDLQLRWFTDRALQYAAENSAAGPAGYGEWVADVEAPREEFRGRYQPMLDDARNLIAQTCTVAPGSGGGAGGGTPAPDLTGPELTSAVARRPRSNGIVATVRCPKEACEVTLRAVIRVPEPARIYRVTGSPVQLDAGARTRIRLKFSRRLRRKVRAALAAGMRVRARVTVTAVDADGNSSRLTRKRRLRP
jgi:hypothetical protein